MGDQFNSLPTEIQDHIVQIAPTTGLPPDDTSLESLAKAWLDKLKVYGDQLASHEMKEADSLKSDEQKGAIALTYSGSLVFVGPLSEGKRKVGYFSIGLRKDVPEAIVEETTALAADLGVSKPALFTEGRIKQTSAIYKIGVVSEELPLLVEEERITEVTMIMTSEFVEVNKALVPVG